MKRRKYFIIILAVLISVSFIVLLPIETDKPFFVTQTFSTVFESKMVERGQGVIKIVDDCMVIESNGLRWHPIWPYGYRYDHDAQMVTNVIGQETIRLNEKIVFGGGTNIEREQILQQTRGTNDWKEQFLGACPPPYWLVSAGSIQKSP